MKINKFNKQTEVELLSKLINHPNTKKQISNNVCLYPIIILVITRVLIRIIILIIIAVTITLILFNLRPLLKSITAITIISTQIV